MMSISTIFIFHARKENQPKNPNTISLSLSVSLIIWTWRRNDSCQEQKLSVIPRLFWIQSSQSAWVKVVRDLHSLNSSPFLSLCEGRLVGSFPSRVNFHPVIFQRLRSHDIRDWAAPSTMGSIK